MDRNTDFYATNCPFNDEECSLDVSDVTSIISSSVPVRPDVAGNGTDAGIGRRTLPGMLQGGHCGSAGQGNFHPATDSEHRSYNYVYKVTFVTCLRSLTFCGRRSWSN